MKLYVLLIIGFALNLTGCETKEQAAPDLADEAHTTAPVAESMAIETPSVEKGSYQNDAFLTHMHSHADQIDLINTALANDDLEAAITPASWLSRHDAVTGIPADWQPYLVGMREAARAVEGAADLETARAASKRITEQCQGCHAAAGMISKGVKQEGD